MSPHPHPSPSSASLSLLLVFSCSLLSFTNTQRHTSSTPIASVSFFFFFTSECVHKRTVRRAAFPSCHLWSGRQVHGRPLWHTGHEWLKSAWRLFNMYLQIQDPKDTMESLFQIGQLFVSANAPRLYSFTSLANAVYLPTPRLHAHHQQSEAVIGAQRSGRSLWHKVGKLTYIPIAPVALVTCCLWGKGIFVGGGAGSRQSQSELIKTSYILTCVSTQYKITLAFVGKVGFCKGRHVRVTASRCELWQILLHVQVRVVPLITLVSLTFHHVRSTWHQTFSFSFIGGGKSGIL